VIPLDYLILRLIRRHLPDQVVRLLLQRRIIIKPGLETLAPAAAAQRFLGALEAAGQSPRGRRVLLFGYGGGFGVGLELLRAGARHVVLLDPFAAPLAGVNLALVARGNPYLSISGSEVLPNPEWLTVVRAPLERYLADGGQPVDLVFSNSVLEHVDNLAGVVPELARVTAPGGEQFHFIDMRDHFFKHPFEMLCHSEKVWRRFLNPGSNLNRLRARDYERLFSRSFAKVTVKPLEANLAAFRAARPRIRPEFLTGDETQDAVTRIFLRASFA
jgi:SAM-dependent methyltransferase